MLKKLLVALACVLPINTNAEVMSFEFEGVVTTCMLCGNAVFPQTFSGSFTIDSVTPAPSFIWNTGAARYYFVGAPYGITWTFGPLTEVYDSVAVTVGNNIVGIYDSLIIESPRIPRSHFQLRDCTGSVFDSVAIPTQINLADFPRPNPCSIFDQVGFGLGRHNEIGEPWAEDVRGVITSVARRVVEPFGLSWFALLIAGMIYGRKWSA
jgi:hypothetical protein